ncbi:unnamed protein product [Aspergillus oryzae]|nr:unnamed protein product [Aspergillus oryzae]
MGSYQKIPKSPGCRQHGHDIRELPIPKHRAYDDGHETEETTRAHSIDNREENKKSERGCERPEGHCTHADNSEREDHAIDRAEEDISPKAHSDTTEGRGKVPCCEYRCSHSAGETDR